MKLVLVLMLCALAAAAPKINVQKEVANIELPEVVQESTDEQRNLLANALVRQLIELLRALINNGSQVFGIPKLDPFVLDEFHVYLPAGLINADLDLKDVVATGIGGFVVHRSNLDLRDLTFDIDISVPNIDIRAAFYDFIGDLVGAVPLYGKGRAHFVVQDIRIRALLFLKQSEDGRSVLIDRIENASFELPLFKSDLTGVIGGGDIDAIVNAVIDDVVIDYVNRFQGAIAAVASHFVIAMGNPILEQLNTWAFIAPLIPRA